MKTNTLSIFPALAVIFITHYNCKLNAQVMSIPKKYIVPDETVNLNKVSDDIRDRMGGKKWVVYSDRDNNNTYTTSDGNIVMKTLQYLDKFFVLDETQTRVKLVKDPKNIIEDWGWIDKSNLLLWERCLVKPLNKIELKAMTLNTAASVKSDINSGIENYEQTHFYKDPNLKIKTGKTSHVYGMFFIFKKQGNSLLLSIQPAINNSAYIKNYIYGWVSEKRLTLWDNRIAIEPNWETEHVNKLNSNDRKLIFFMNKNELEDYTRNGTGEKKSFMVSPFKNERMIGADKRFPSLDNEPKSLLERQIYNVGVMGDVKTGKGILEKEKHALMTKKYNELRSNLRTINLFFVVDATGSMRSFYTPICRAIKNTMENKKSELYTYRFGATIYRDEAEKKENGGLGLSDTKTLTNNSEQIVMFLNGVSCNELKDRDKPEAVFYGLREALKSGGLSDKETNLVILIGDAGNHSREDKSQVKDKEIIDLLVKKKCHFLSFQVNRGPDVAYEDFNVQMETIMEKIKRKIIDDPDYQKSFKVAYGKQLEQPKTVHSDSVDYLTNSPFMARSVHPIKGISIPPDKLTGEIEKIIKDITDYTETLLTKMKGTFEEGEGITEVTSEQDKKMETQGFSYSSAIMFYLKEMGISEDELSKISSKSFQLYTEGYTPSYYIIQNETIPAFKPVLLYTQFGLGDLISDINKLVDVNISTDKVRDRMVSTWIEIFKGHAGNVDAEEVENHKLEDIYMHVFGLPGKSNLLNVKLKDFKDASIISDEKLFEYQNLIKQKLDDLIIICGNPLTQKYRRFMSGDTQYFWIEQDLIP